ncbi:hypothetical protein HPB51_006718 [Rhipicephalus microplus]|uniref:Peptidase M12B domain-containing protein n=1 Tax=Rhipicephalus microplus TaxID=6941 RepID=A0A9J6E7G6_RHIMP|nr:hypothetical protein HPB51_006718 [Rhipicephalus microplus]
MREANARRQTPRNANVRDDTTTTVEALYHQEAAVQRAALIFNDKLRRNRYVGLQENMVVYPRLLEERGDDGAMVVSIHDGLALNLRKVSVTAPTLVVHEHENGKPIVRFTEFYSSFRPSVLQFSFYYFFKLNKKDKASLLAERQYNYYQTVPAEVTVELFVISDKIHQQRFTQTQRLLSYMCVMVNSANLRLQDTSAPRIKLLLVGLERVHNAWNEPYLKGDDQYMDDTETITNLVEHIKTRKHLYGDPDAVYLATGRDMYAMDSGAPDTRRKGLAFVAGVCTELFVAIGEDNAGSYDGMHALTHEVAHLLGAAHDGDAPKTNIVPGHPGALACPFSQGYIMSYVNTGPNYHRFSPCSVVQIRYVMR